MERYGTFAKVYFSHNVNLQYFYQVHNNKKGAVQNFFFGSRFDGCNKSTGSMDMKTYTNIGHEIPPHPM